MIPSTTTTLPVTFLFALLFGVVRSQTLQTVVYNNPPVLGSTASVNPSNPAQKVTSQDVYYGAFSGLVFQGITPSGSHVFVATMDRGPTAGNIKNVVPVTGTDKKENGKAFVLPTYNPRFLILHINFETKDIEISREIMLVKEDGVTGLTGLPNLQYSAQDLAYTDNYAVDLFGNLVDNDPLGADIESIAVAPDGSYWAGDEYRPSIYHFDQNGKLLDRFIPIGSPTANGKFGIEALPAVYAQRQQNRGFEAVALEGDLLYAFTQSPLDNPNSKKNTVGISSRNIRILVFNIKSKSTVAEYVYELGYDPQHVKVDKISDATPLGNGKFLVVERDASNKPTSFKLVFEVDVKGATDINDPENLVGIPHNQTVEQLVISTTNIIPVKKTQIVNVVSLGWNVDNVEGLTVVNSTTIAVVSDNDFQLNSDDDAIGDGTANFDRTKLTLFGLISNLTFSKPVIPTMYSVPSSPSYEGSGVGMVFAKVVVVAAACGVVGIILVGVSVFFWKKHTNTQRPFVKLESLHT